MAAVHSRAGCSRVLASVPGIGPSVETRRPTWCHCTARAPATPRLLGRTRGLLLAWASAGNSAPTEASAYPVFSRMASRGGLWVDSVRYVQPALEETPRVRLSGTTRVTVEEQAGRVRMATATVFPNGKTLEMTFSGGYEDEAFGLKGVVRLEREGGGPVVLLASEHPAQEDQDSFDTLIVREVLAETGRVLLTNTITLIGGDDGAALEAVHTAQEIQEDGSLGGVQLWRSRQSTYGELE
mmetsp:Transcript_19349/g.49701  ORF Transcript_19349/g.49701 Transcript_19349/m.49701 type:complete len:240 (+) Transcript_19349:108-827(+)